MNPTWTDDAILAEITGLAHDKLEWQGPVDRTMRLVEDLRLDSIRLLTLAMEVEDRFRICLDEDDESRVLTVGDLVALVHTKVRQNESDHGELSAADAPHG